MSSTSHSHIDGSDGQPDAGAATDASALADDMVCDRTGPSPDPPDPAPLARAGASKTAELELEGMIERGEIEVGGTLPPERELARTLAVSRTSLREALSVLAAKGLVSIERGRGTFVRSRTPTDAAFGRWSFADQYSPAEVFQFRYVAESQAARLAAMHHTGEDLAAIKTNFERILTAVRARDIATFARVDLEFHQLIIRFSQNRLLIDIHRNFVGVVSESLRLPLQHRNLLWEAATEHERIIEALTMSDPDGAAYYMRQHLSRAASRADITFIELA